MNSLQLQVVKRIILVIEWGIFLALLIGVGLFVQDIWFDYLSKATAIKAYTEEYHGLEVIELSSKYLHTFYTINFSQPPTMIMCFNPPIKHSVLQKYGTSSNTILGRLSRNHSSTPAIYEEGNYNWNEDFVLKIYESVDFHVSKISHEVEPIYTLLNGKCHKLTFDRSLKGKTQL